MALIRQNSSSNFESHFDTLSNEEPSINPEVILSNLYKENVFTQKQEFDTFIDSWLGLNLDEDFAYFNINPKIKSNTNTIMNKYMNQFVDDLDYGSNALLDISDDLKTMEISEIKEKLKNQKETEKIGIKRKRPDSNEKINKKKNA
jgi:hypothetical protein